MSRIIDRYLAREVTIAWLGVIGVLLLVLLTSRFARFLAEAASGNLPQDVVFSLIGLTSIYYVIVLIPPALFLAVLTALGRMYRDSEMAALAACGVGGYDLYRPFLRVAIVIAILVGFLGMAAGPWAGEKASRLKQVAQYEASVGLVEPGRFVELAGGVFYAEQVKENGRQLGNVFLHREVLDDSGRSRSDLIIAESGYQDFNRDSGQRVLILRDGTRYEGLPGAADFRITEFREQGVRLQLETPEIALDRRSFIPTKQLLASDDLEDKAELHWRLSLPVSVILLTLLAVPIGRIRPRQGRYARLFWGILIYVIYFNGIGILQVGLERGYIPIQVGLWPIHIAVLAFALWLGKREGLFLPRKQRRRLSTVQQGSAT